MPKPVYKRANKFHRVDKMSQPFNKPRRAASQNYYQQARKVKRRRAWRIIQVIILLLLLQSIFQIPQLKIDRIEFRRLENVPTTEIELRLRALLDESRLLIFKNSNYFLFQSRSIEQILADQYFLEDISIQKQFPKTLIFEATEKISPFVRQTPDAYYSLSYTGETLGQSNQPPTDTYIIADERGDLTQNVPLSYLEEATDLLAAWQVDPSLIRLDRFHLTDEPDLLRLSTDKDLELIFGTAEDYTNQINRLEEILQQNILPTDTEYVDLRFANNIYFK